VVTWVPRKLPQEIWAQGTGSDRIWSSNSINGGREDGWQNICGWGGSRLGINFRSYSAFACATRKFLDYIMYAPVDVANAVMYITR
jgi:hypothetical protein